MKKVLFLFAVLASTLSFVSCSDDDDDAFEIEQLTGEWYLVNWVYEDSEGRDEDSYEFNQPTENSDCAKLKISKVSDNRYEVIQYGYYNGNWYEDDNDICILNGRSLTVDGETVNIAKLDSNYLIVEIKGSDEDGDFYSKQTYRRIN